MGVWKFVHDVAHQQTRLPHAAVAHDGALQSLRRDTVDVGANRREGAVFGLDGVCAIHARDGRRRALLHREVDARLARRDVADGRRLVIPASAAGGGRGRKGRGARGSGRHGKRSSFLRHEPVSLQRAD